MGCTQKITRRKVVMRGTKFTRLIALLMSVLMLLGCATVVASAAAADSGSSMTNQSLAGIKELLNTESYGAY